MLSKHLLIGGGAIALSLLSMSMGISASSATDSAATGEGSKALLGFHVIAADRALLPLVANFATATEAATNPFTMKRADFRPTRLSPPPPPRLDLPALPTLPISER